jgi:hypothetical protein
MNFDEKEIEKKLGSFRLKRPPESLMKNYEKEVWKKIHASGPGLSPGLGFAFAAAFALAFLFAFIFLIQPRLQKANAPAPLPSPAPISA